MKIKTENPNNEVSTIQMFEAMDEFAKAYNSIKKSHKNLKKFKKLLNAGLATQAEYDKYLENSRFFLSKQFEQIASCGMFCGQGEEDEHLARGKLHADDVIADATK
jgi:predicted translin family RNA/ssDNA-binding protein